MSTKTRALRTAGVTLSVAALALSAVGCTATTSTSGSQERELTSRAEPPGDQAVADVVWNLPQGEPNTIDPPNAATYSGAGVVTNLCDPLLSVDEDYKLGPNLATFEQVTPTQIVYTLAQDAAFWDGTPVTAEDVAFSLQRAAHPSSIVSFIFANVASITVSGDNAVTVDFSVPDVLFNYEMATFAGMVVQRAFTEAAGEQAGSASAGVMCSGPYQFESWTPGESIVLTKNSNYWNGDLPLLADRVTFRFIADTAASTQAMIAGEIDGSYQLDPAAIPSLSSSTAGRLFFGPSMESTVLSIVVPDGPLADPNLREALQVMIDRQSIADVVYNGAATPLYWSVTPTTWPNDQKERYEDAYEEWVDARAFDVDKARSLVESSGYDGTPLTLAVGSGEETSSKLAQLVQQQGEEVGITIQIKEIQPLEFAEAAYDKATRERLAIDLTIGGSFNAVQEPLEPMGFTVLPGAAYNASEFDDPQVTELVTTALQTFDSDERADMTLEAMDIIEKASFTIPLVSTNTVTFLNNELGGAITSFAYMSMPAMAYLGGVSE
ncbi:ABC transporter substrate-binding protein [Microbacterium sp. PMB16]|uniref:ABC transporter substrate-binding protein n=1 Tax=Microbacterium sp. PMB16 TaxID=3120157 RepID=UPI003F4B3AB3